MAKTVGFESGRVAIMKDDETVDKTQTALGATGIYDLNAKTSQGVLGANISGLAPTYTTIYGSDMVVEVSGKGSGAVKVALTANDIPDDVLDALAGMTKDSKSGATVLGRDTVAPYSILEMNSHDRFNNYVHFAVLKGKFEPENHNLQTNEASEKLATDSVTFNAVSRLSDAMVYAKISEAEETYDSQKWQDYIFPGGGADTDSIPAPTNVTATPTADGANIAAK